MQALYEDPMIKNLKDEPQDSVDESQEKDGPEIVMYKHCRKNHAANIGKYAVDGCCEFMPAGEAGSSSALLCAACGCHRNFHAKVVLQRDQTHCDDCGCHRNSYTKVVLQSDQTHCEDCSSLSTNNTPK